MEFRHGGAELGGRFGPDTWVTQNAGDMGDRSVERWVTKSREIGDQSIGRSVTGGRDIGELDGGEETGDSRDIGNTEASCSGNALAEDVSDG
jgi:hypothetical protein